MNITKFTDWCDNRIDSFLKWYDEQNIHVRRFVHGGWVLTIFTAIVAIIIALIWFFVFIGSISSWLLIGVAAIILAYMMGALNGA